MSSINRKKFLRLSAWGFVASLLPIHEIKALSFISDLKTTFNQDDYLAAINKAKLAKEHFFKKEYSIAENLYLECIKLAPSDIRFYDNLQNVYGAQGKLLNIVELFKNALISNPNKISFYDRAAKSLMRLELGDKILGLQYREENKSNSLLQDASQLYKKALIIKPDVMYLKVGDGKIISKIEEDALNKNYRVDGEYKLKKNQRRLQHAKRYESFSNEELIARISSIDNRKRNKLYLDSEIKLREKNITKEKKLIFRILISRLIESNLYVNATEYAEQLFSIDSLDPTSLKILRRLYIKTKSFNKLINLQRDYANVTQNVFANLGLMHYLQLAYLNGAVSINALDESISIGEDLIFNWSLLEFHKIDVTDKLAKSYILSKNYLTAQGLYRELIDKTNERSVAHLNKLLLGYARTYFELKNYNMSQDICLVAIGDVSQNNQIEYIEDFVARRVNLEFKDNLDFYYLLVYIYKASGDHLNKQDILKTILKYDPENKFALKRIS